MIKQLQKPKLLTTYLTIAENVANKYEQTLNIEWI